MNAHYVPDIPEQRFIYSVWLYSVPGLMKLTQSQWQKFQRDSLSRQNSYKIPQINWLENNPRHRTTMSIFTDTLNFSPTHNNLFHDSISNSSCKETYAKQKSQTTRQKEKQSKLWASMNGLNLRGQCELRSSLKYAKN
jgi:hypothetical protein